MAVSVSIVALVVLAFALGRVEAAIGPQATLIIANKVIAPGKNPCTHILVLLISYSDGFPRSCVPVVMASIHRPSNSL